MHPLFHILSKNNLFHRFSFYFCNIQINIILTSMFRPCSHILPPKTLQFSPLSCVTLLLSSHSLSISSPAWFTVSCTKNAVPHFANTSSLLLSPNLPQQSFLMHLQVIYVPYYETSKSHTHINRNSVYFNISVLHSQTVSKFLSLWLVSA